MDADRFIQQRLGLNKAAYLGETIQIAQVVSQINDLALAQGWTRELFYTGEQFELIALSLQPVNSRFRIYISAGIHGDEPAGPLAILELIQQNRWPEGVEIWLCPCLNPSGFILNRRENAGGIDLNRQYHAPECDEVRSHIDWLSKAPSFDLAICIHEDWESNGYYLYELNPDSQPTQSLEIIEAVARVCPIDTSPEIEGRPASGGIIRPSTDPFSRPLWPEAFYLMVHKTRHSYTLESPSDFPLPVRVRAHLAALRTIFDGFACQVT